MISGRMSIHGLMRDVESASLREAIQLSAGPAPGKFRTRPLIIAQVGRNRPVLGLDDR